MSKCVKYVIYKYNYNNLKCTYNCMKLIVLNSFEYV